MNILTAPPTQYLPEDEVVKLVAECEKVKINVQPITFDKYTTDTNHLIKNA